MPIHTQTICYNCFREKPEGEGPCPYCGFDLKENEFSGFLSDSRITDIDEENIATTITIRDITKMADQLDHSMGSYMNYFQILCILLAAVMIYLSDETDY